jgi:type II secretory pathway pseudopilin PulG
MTLLELIVTLTIIAVSTLVVGLAVPIVRRASEADPASIVLQLRDSAIRSGRTVTSNIVFRSGITIVTALPDGRILADSMLGFDPFSGSRSSAAR